MTSVTRIVAVRDRRAYAMTKFVMVGLTPGLGLNHSNTGVRCNAICPDRVETLFVAARITKYPNPAPAYRERSATQLNRRMIWPKEIAAAAIHLAVDSSAMVTGITLMIDGSKTADK